MKAVGELGRKDLLGAVRENLKADDGAVRYWAAWSGALLGEPSAIPVLQGFAIPGKPNAEKACAMAVRRMSVQDAYAWQKMLSGRPETLRLAVQAVGVIGDPVLMPWFFEQMAIPAVARVAGESFSMITGVDLAYDDLDGEWPEGFEAWPTENPEDENVARDADEDLPWPNVALLQKWWHEHKKDIQKGTRYLCGEPMSIGSLNRVLRNGFQRQRIVAALELAIHQPDMPLFETRAPGFRQQKLYGKG